MRFQTRGEIPFCSSCNFRAEELIKLAAAEKETFPGGDGWLNHLKIRLTQSTELPELGLGLSFAIMVFGIGQRWVMNRVDNY